MNVVNSGSTLLTPEYAEVRVQQVIPVPQEIDALAQKGVDPVEVGETEYSWPMLVDRKWSWPAGELEIEPGESDALHADFVIKASVRTVKVYAFVGNPQKKDEGLGWTATRLLSFGTADGSFGDGTGGSQTSGEAATAEAERDEAAEAQASTAAPAEA